MIDATKLPRRATQFDEVPESQPHRVAGRIEASTSAAASSGDTVAVHGYPAKDFVIVDGRYRVIERKK